MVITSFHPILIKSVYTTKGQCQCPRRWNCIVSIYLIGMFYELQYTKVTALPVLTWLVFFQTMQTGLFSHTPDAAQDTQIALLSEHPSLCIVLDALPHEPTSAQTISFTLCRSATLHCFHCKQRDIRHGFHCPAAFEHSEKEWSLSSDTALASLLCRTGYPCPRRRAWATWMAVVADTRAKGKQDTGLHQSIAPLVVFGWRW